MKIHLHTEPPAINTDSRLFETVLKELLPLAHLNTVKEHLPLARLNTATKAPNT